jgi:hypothetical protein
VTKKKVLNMTPEVNVSKLFFLVSEEGAQKPKCLSWQAFLAKRKMFMSMAKTFPRGEHHSGALGLLANITLGWKSLPGLSTGLFGLMKF